MKNKISEHLLQQYAPEQIIQALSPYLTLPRQTRIDSVIQHRLNSITLAIENPADINNALACVRTAEGLGLCAVHIISPQRDTRYIHNMTQSACYWVDIIFHDTLQAFCTIMENENRLLAGAVIDSPTQIYSLPIEKPLCILIGNEEKGLSDQAKTVCDILFSIPHCGIIDSYNLSVAAAISLFTVTQKKRSILNQDSDLSVDAAQMLRAKYYLNSVKPRLAKQLLGTVNV